MLEIQSLKKTFFPGTVNEKKALNGVSLHLAKGDFVCLIGSNGAGKSTLLNAVSGEFFAGADSGALDPAAAAAFEMRRKYSGDRAGLA